VTEACDKEKLGHSKGCLLETGIPIRRHPRLRILHIPIDCGEHPRLQRPDLSLFAGSPATGVTQTLKIPVESPVSLATT
jgi:hypothetical protein